MSFDQKKIKAEFITQRMLTGKKSQKKHKELSAKKDKQKKKRQDQGRMGWKAPHNKHRQT